MIMLALSGALYLARNRSPLIVPVCCSPSGIVFKTSRCLSEVRFCPALKGCFWPIAACTDGQVTAKAAASKGGNFSSAIHINPHDLVVLAVIEFSGSLAFGIH